jgi:nicotinate-nucleotide adenylyltransferase
LSGAPRPSRIFQGLPPHADGQKIGLYGGSFNPAHAGHRQASLLALKRLGLDQLWWVVTPGNPLKSADGLPPLATRMEQAAAVASHPRIVVTGMEAPFGTRYTAELIRILKKRAPKVRFVWVMGSDNLAQLDRWDDWREIARNIPIAVVNRPGYLTTPLSARAAQALSANRIDERLARVLAYLHPPAWIYLTGPRTASSSTALRARAFRSSSAQGKPQCLETLTGALLS